MDEQPKTRGREGRDGEGRCLLAGVQESVLRLFEETDASRWGLARDVFASALERGARRRFPGEAPTPKQLQEHFATLHAEDLALACACAEGSAAAWEEFVHNYRGYLRASAAAILRCPSMAPEAIELADSLFAELYGLADGKRGERSLFRYFHGRSSLKTWLRAVLAQRHVDAVRAAKRFKPLEEDLDGDTSASLQKADGANHPVDPHRARYLEIFKLALEAALQKLDPRDHERLRLYYAQEQTLAEIGRKLGEHESSVSRNLERVRRALRANMEESLRRGDFPLDFATSRKGLDEAQIELCFEYAAEDAPIDLDRLLTDRSNAESPQPRRQT